MADKGTGTNEESDPRTRPDRAKPPRGTYSEEEIRKRVEEFDSRTQPDKEKAEPPMEHIPVKGSFWCRLRHFFGEILSLIKNEREVNPIITICKQLITITFENP